MQDIPLVSNDFVNPVIEKPNRGELKVPCLVFSRVCGYMQPVQSWNIGKQQEFKDRKVFSRFGSDRMGAITETRGVEGKREDIEYVSV